MRRLLVLGLLVAAPALLPAPAQAATTCVGHKVTIRGGPAATTINGTPRSDVIDAGAGDDVVNGRGGNDIICGGPGADDLRGNAGHDRLHGGADRVTTEKFFSDTCNQQPSGYCLFVTYDGDLLRGNSGQDVLVPGYDDRHLLAFQTSRNPDQLRWDTSPRGVRVNLTRKTSTGDGTDTVVAAGVFEVVTSRFADTVVGTNGADQISTGAGADTVFARGGDDHVSTGSTSATVAEETHGGPGQDRLVGGSGPTHLFGDEGEDTLSDDSAIGADQLHGGPGDDEIRDLIGASAGQVVDGGGDPGDAFEARLGVGGQAAWDMVTGVMSFTTPSATTVSAPGFHAFSYTSGFATTWDVTGTDQADDVQAPGTFHGAGGDDHYTGGSGADSYDGGQGSDRYDSDAGGADTCSSVEVDPQSDRDLP